MKSVWLFFLIAITWVFIAGFHEPLYNVNSNILDRTLDSFQYGEIPAEYNQEEASHLEDVKVLLQSLFIIMIISAVFVFSSSITSFVTRKAGIRLMIISGAFVIALIFFNSSFTMFHKIFFNGDTWLFPRGSLILKMFPLIYFKKALGLIVIGWFSSGIGLFILSKRLVN